MRNFVTPHCHPNSLDSASTPETFAQRELELGTGAITVTDHGTLQACRRVYDLAKKKGLTPIVGLEGYMRDDNCELLAAAGIPKLHPLKKNKEPDLTKAPTYAHYLKYMHFTVHFLDQEAFQCGVKLLSKAPIEKHGSEHKPLFSWADLEELGSYNVTFGSGCLIGIVQRHLMAHGNVELAIKHYEKFRSLAKPGNFYVEVFPHICDRNWEQGVFVTVNTGDGAREWKYHDGKKLKTNHGEIEAADLAKAFNKKDNKHEFLLAVKDYQKWEDKGELRILNVEKREGFLMNECTPWAPTGDLQRPCNDFVMRLARRYGDKILISDDSHFATPEYKEVQDIRLQQGGSWRFHTSYHRLSSSDAYGYFEKQFGTEKAEFESWIENSYEWRDKFKAFNFKTEVSLPRKFYPEDTVEHLKQLIRKHGRMDWSDQKRVGRLMEEIKLFHGNGVVDLLPYFFLAEDSIDQYRKRGKLTGPGRGSAAGCLTTYLLGITHKDPLRYNLSLERFLTLDRIKAGAWPDIDMDFPDRDILVGPDGEGGWLQERFGDHFAQISTETLLRLKSSARDVARVKLGSIPQKVDALIRKFEDAPQGVADKDFVFGYEDSGEFKQGSIERDKALQQYIKEYGDHWEVVRKTLALSRSKSRHASAYVIANKPIPELGIPLTTIGGHRCTAYTMQAVEAMGGIKMDYLVIKSLLDITDAIQLIQKESGVAIGDDVRLNGLLVPKVQLIPHQGRLVDVWDLPADPAVYADISAGRTETVFQFNTGGAVKWLDYFNETRPDGTPLISSLEDLAIFTALDRPGPLDMEVPSPDGRGKHNLLVEYARRARGMEPSTGVPSIFDQLLPETYGVLVYQEQLQYVFQKLTGCSLSEAEQFRRDIAKKKMDKVLAVYPTFIEKAGALASKEVAEAAWEFLKTWANYGFNKSHAICYSDIGYACAFLKHHFPLQWWAAVLSNATKDEVNTDFWRHCGHLIDLPDVTKSGEKFEIRDGRLQAPISLLFGIGEAAHAELCAGAPYKDIVDFCQKVQAHKERLATVETERVVKKAKTRKNKKTGEVVVIVPETIEERTKRKLGRTSLTSKVAETLIISGTMDSLFPPDTHVREMLDTYTKVMEEVTTAAAGEENPLKAAINPKYENITDLDRYVIRKQALPAYSQVLLPLVAKEGLGGIEVVPGGYQLVRGKFKVSVETGPEMERLERCAPSKEWLAVVGYVEEIRDFNYGEGKKNEARAVTMDIDGVRREFVKWPEKATGKLPGRFKQLDLPGSICLVTLSRYRGDKPFSLDDIEIIRSPISTAKEEEETNEPAADHE